MQAWIEAECTRPGDRRAIVAAVESAVRSAGQGPAERLLGQYYYRVPPAIRPLLGQPDQAGLRQLLGFWPPDLHGEFRPGLAMLTERECQAYHLRIRGWSPWEIARELTPARQQFDRRLWIKLETVHQYCWRARVKVLQAFGLPVPEHLDEEVI